MLKPGDVAPDFALPTVEGRQVSLQQFLGRGRHVWLVFLRHLG